MRPKLLAIALALLSVLAVTTMRHRSPIAPQIVTTAAVAPAPAYSGPTTNRGADLTRAIQRALDEQRFAEAVAQQEHDAAIAAQAHVAHAPTSRQSSAPIVGTGDAETAVRQHFGDIFSQAWGVSDCESGHNPGAISPGGGNWGLFQINRPAHEADFVQFANAALDDSGAPADDVRRTWSGGVLNADLNAAYARKLYNGGGWKAWSCAWAAY